MSNKPRKTIIDIALAIILATAVIGGVLTVLFYGDAWGQSNVYREDEDMDIDFVPQVYMFMKADTRYEFENFDEIEDGIDHFIGSSEGERCLTTEGKDATFRNHIHVNVGADSVIADWNAPETIYCLTAEPPFVTPMTLQGVVVNVDGNGVGHDAPMHMRDSAQTDCDGTGSEYFGGYEVEPDATGYASVHILYKEGYICDGMPSDSDLVVIVPEQKWFID